VNLAHHPTQNETILLEYNGMQIERETECVSKEGLLGKISIYLMTINSNNLLAAETTKKQRLVIKDNNPAAECVYGAEETFNIYLMMEYRETYDVAATIETPPTAEMMTEMLAIATRTMTTVLDDVTIQEIGAVMTTGRV